MLRSVILVLLELKMERYNEVVVEPYCVLAKKVSRLYTQAKRKENKQTPTAHSKISFITGNKCQRKKKNLAVLFFASPPPSPVTEINA